jgi:hypothetical protein
MPGTSCPDGTPKAMCLAGDMAAKHGGLKAQDGDKVFYDETLSLYGAYRCNSSLLFLSRVMHVQDAREGVCPQGMQWIEGFQALDQHCVFITE